jgi:nuclear pore complex protein Nup50
LTGAGTKQPELSNGHAKSPQKSAYMQQLKALNESVLQWIQKHVTSNPYCILTPIFKDYEKHLEEISKSKEASPQSTTAGKEENVEEKKEEKEEMNHLRVLMKID